jgi:serine/threonine protein kinase
LNDKWTLVQLLGVGGASAVYEAVHRNGHRVAVKVLSNPGASAPAIRLARSLAARESRIANAIDHPGAVVVLDDDVNADGTAFLVMELLEGETLEEARRCSGGRVPLPRALWLLEQLLDVLAAAHERGIIHRDIKPENLFLTTAGQLKVLDFGLASVGLEDQDRPRWFGTPGFMAPEQARGAATETDALTDLWAAAATFFVAVTGLLVHPERTTEAIVEAAITADVDLSPLAIWAPVEVVDVFARALAFDKRHRWPSATAMRTALALACSQGIRQRRRRAAPMPKAAPVPRRYSNTRVFRIDSSSQWPDMVPTNPVTDADHDTSADPPRALVRRRMDGGPP